MGHNHYTVQDCHINMSTHAEVDAVNNLPKAPRKKTMVTMFVLRIDRNGEMKYSKPCAGCQKYMKKILKKRGYYLTKIHYTVADENFESMKL